MLMPRTFVSEPTIITIALRLMKRCADAGLPLRVAKASRYIGRNANMAWCHRSMLPLELDWHCLIRRV
jgi:hypothetical protein